MKEKLRVARRKQFGKRGLAFVLAVLMIVTSVSWPDNMLSAWADGPEMCANHPEHTAECGYVEAVEGQPCSHVCGDGCVSTELTCEKAEHTHTDECNGNELICEIEEHTHGGECYTIVNQCQHIHNEECGYVEAVEGQPCNHSCELCDSTEEESNSGEQLDERVTALIERINALPTAEDIENYDEAQKEALLEELNEIGELLDNYYEEELIDDELYTELYTALLACNEAIIGDSIETLESVTGSSYFTADKTSSTWNENMTVYGNVTWDDTLKAAKFDGASGDSYAARAYVTLSGNPLTEIGVTQETGFTISFDAKVDPSCTEWGRLFDFGVDSSKYVFVNAGNVYQNYAAGYGVLEICYGYPNGAQNAESYSAPNKDLSYIQFNTLKQTITDDTFDHYDFVVAPGGSTTLYVNDEPVTWLSNDARVTNVLGQISNFANFYIGRSAINANDGSFKGYIKNFEIVANSNKGTYNGSAMSYSIVYNTNGGNSVNATTGTALPNSLPTPTKAGYVFDGWYMDAELTTAAVAGTAISANTTLYAKWTKNPAVKAIVSTNNGVSWTEYTDIDAAFNYVINNGTSANPAILKLESNWEGVAKGISSYVIIDLNGYTISNLKNNVKTDYNGAKRPFRIEAGGTLVIRDTSSEQNGAIINTEDLEQGGAIYVPDGTLILESGNIRDNSMGTSGGVGLGNNGTFYMKGGKITGNSAIKGTGYAWGRGGGVHVWGTNAKFEMTGGEITANSATDKGDGASFEGTSAQMIVGGTAKISGNTRINGQNLYLYDGKLISVSETTPLAEGASLYVTTQTAPTKGNPIQITTAGSCDNSSYFSSDNANYKIYNKIDTNNKQYLVLSVHEHNLSYIAEGNVLKAYCTEEFGNTNCDCYGENNAISVTLSATSQPYTGVAYAGASITDVNNAWKNNVGTLSVDDIVYYLSDGTTKTTSANSGASAEGKAPVNSGNYLATITVGEKTAQTSFIIKTNQTASVTIGNNITYYNSFASALAAANAATQDCTLTILNSCTQSGPATVKNVNGKKITLDIGDSDTTLTISATANSQNLLDVNTDVDFVGDGGKIVFNLNNKNGINGIYSNKVCIIRMYDGFNILAKDGGTDERILWIQNGPKCYIYGGSIKTSNIKTASTIVCSASSMYIYDGEFGWNITGNGTSNYWAGVTDSFQAVTFEIYGGYFDGPLWWGDTNSTEVYKFYGGKFNTNKIKNSQANRDGNIDWTPYIGAGNTVNDINETKNGVTYKYEIVNPNIVNCSATSSNEAYGTASVSSLKALKNSTVVFTATAEKGYAFVKWVDEEGTSVSTDAVYSMTITQDTALKAVFEKCDHDVWNYTANGPTITATCAKEGCVYFTTPVTVTIKANSGYYTGSAVSATLAKDSDFPVSVADSDIVYYLSDGTTKTNNSNSGASGEGKAPVKVGSYKAKLTVGDVTANKNFRINSESSKYQPLAISSSSLNGNTVYGMTESGSCKLDQSCGFYANGRNSNLSSGGFPVDGSVTINSVPYKLAAGSDPTKAYDGKDSIQLTSSYTQQTMDLQTLGSYQTIYVLGTAGGPGSGNYANFSVVLTYTDGTTATTSYRLYDWYDSTSVTGVYKDPRFRRTSSGSSPDGTTTGGPYVQSATISADPSKLLKSITFKMTGKNGGTSTSGLYCGIYAVTGKIADGAPTSPEISGTPTTVGGTSFVAVWDEVEGAESYVLDVATDINFTQMLPAYNNLNVGNVLSKLVTGLTPGTTYYYRVRAIKNNVASGSSDPIEVTTKKHEHVWTYTASADKIIATAACNSETDLYDYCSYKDKSGADRNIVLTLSASDVTFSGETYSKASIDNLEIFKETTKKEVSLSDVIYYLEDGETLTNNENSGAAGNGKAPVSDGKYKASITVEEKTAYADFEIKDREAEISFKLAYEGDVTLPAGRQDKFKISAVTADAPMPSRNILTVNAPTKAGIENAVTGSWTIVVNANKEFEYKVTQITTKATGYMLDNGYWLITIKGETSGVTVKSCKYVTDGSEETKPEAVFVNGYSCPHDKWKYTADGGVITAQCITNNSCEYHENVQKLTLTAPESPVYSGTSYSVSFAIDDAFPEKHIAEEVVYCTEDGTTRTSKTNSGAVGVGKAPVFGGKYVAYIVAGEKTAKVEFEIAKKLQTIKSPNVLEPNVKTNEVTLIPVAAGQGATKYAVNTINLAPASEDKWQSETTFTNLSAGTKYYFFAKYEGNRNYISVVSSSAEVTTKSKTVLDEEPGGIEPTEDPDDPENPGTPDIPKIPYEEPYEIYPGLYTGEPEFPGEPVGEVKTTYYYEGREGTEYGPIDVKPTEIGKYYYVIRMEDDVKVAIKKLPFEISKKDAGPVSGTEPGTGSGETPKDPDDPEGPKIPEIPNDQLPFNPDPVIVTGDPQFPGGYTPTGEVEKTYTYEGREDTVYGPSKVQPTNPGKYYYVITIEDDISKAVEKIPFEITKKVIGGDTGVDPTPGKDDGDPQDPSDPAGPKIPEIPGGEPYSPYPDIFDGDPMPGFPEGYEPTGETVTTYTYEGREGTIYGPTETQPTKAGKYYLVITVSDDVNRVVQKIPFEITKEEGGPLEGGNPTPGENPGGEPQDPSNPGGPTIPEIPVGETPISVIPEIIDSEPELPAPHTGKVVTTYTYEGREGTVYGPSKVQPTKVGKYYLVITVEDDVKKSVKKVAFEITKNDKGDDTGVIPTPGENPGGEPQDPSNPDGPTIPEIPNDELPIAVVPGIISGEPGFPDDYTPKGTPVTTYTYEGREGTVYGPSETQPTEAGKYYLVITVEDDENKIVQKVAFEITKKIIGDDTGVDPTPGSNPDGEPQDPSDPAGPKIPEIPGGTPWSPSPDIFDGDPEPGFPGGYEPVGPVVTSYTYEGREGTVYGPSAEKPTLAGKYNLIITVEDNKNRIIQKIPFEITKTEGPGVGTVEGITPVDSDPEASFPSGDDWTPNPSLYTGTPDLSEPHTGTVVTSFYYEGREGTNYGPSETKPVAAGKYYYVIKVEDSVKMAIEKIPFTITKVKDNKDIGVEPTDGPDDGEPQDPSDPDGPTVAEIPFNKLPIEVIPGIITGTPGFPDDYTPVGNVVITYTYEGRDGTVYGPSETKPTALGKYYLIVTVEDDTRTVSKKYPFSITKIKAYDIDVEPSVPGVIPADPNGGEPFTNPVPLIIKETPVIDGVTKGTSVVTYTYEGRDGTIYPADGIPTTVRPTAGGKYNLIITIEDDINLLKTKIPFEIEKSATSEDTGVEPAEGPENGTPVDPADPDGPKIPEIPYNPDEPLSPVPDIIVIDDPDGPGFENEAGEVKTSYSYEGRDGTVYPENGGTTTVKPVNAGKYNLIVTVEDDVKISVAKYPFEITKLSQDKPELKSLLNPDGIGCYNELVKGLANGRITGLSEDLLYEYSLDASNWNAVPAESKEITNLPAETILLRLRESENYKASAAVSVQINEGVYIKLDDSTWNSVLNAVTLGAFFNKTQTVTVENIKADNSAVKKVEYYISTKTETEASLDAVKTWKNYTSLGVKLNPTDNYVVCFKIYDVFGGYVYMATDGIIIDTEAPVITGISSDKSFESSTSEIKFYVEDKFLDKVTYTKSGEAEVTLTGTDTSVATKKEFVLPAGTYDSIVAVDKSGNKTVITNVTVTTGQDKPELSKPYIPGENGNPGTPATPTKDEGPYVIYPTVNPVNGTEPVFTFDYKDTDPEKAEITGLNPDYEIYTAPLDENGNPTVGPLTGNPITVPAGTPIYVRKKAVPPTTGPSDFVELTIPAAATTIVYLDTEPSGVGTLKIDNKTSNHKKVYTGTEMTISASAKGKYEFSKWIDKQTGATVSTTAEFTYKPETKNSSEYLTAVFNITGEDVVEVPEPKEEPEEGEEPTTGGVVSESFVYDGTLKTSIKDTDIPAHVTLKDGSVTTATNVGKYSFTLKLETGYKWNDGTTTEKIYVWHIFKAGSTEPTVSYNSDEKVIEITSTPGRNVIVKKGENGSEKEYTSFTGGSGEIYPTENGEPVSDSNPLVPGTYYVKVVGDENHEDSAWVPVIVGAETPTIKYQGVKDVTNNPVKVTVTTTLSTTDGVKKIIFRYRKKGSTEWIESTEEVPVTITTENSFPGATDTLLNNTDYEYQTVLVMEGSDDESSADDYEIEGEIRTVHTPKETDDNKPGKGEISVIVENETDDDSKVITVSVEKGNVAMASETMTVTSGSQVQTTPVTNLDDGVYNILLRTQDGCFVETQSLTVNKGSAETATFTIKAGELKTEVSIGPGAPAVAVGGLPGLITAAEAEAAKRGEKKVEVTLEVDVKSADEAEGANEILAISKGEGEKIALYLDLNLYKTTSKLNTLTGEAVNINTEDIGKTNKIVLEIAVPFDTKNCEKIDLIRCHNGVTSKLNRLYQRPEKNYVDGSFFVGDGYVFIYASGFSTYAISTKAKTSGSDDPSDSDDLDGKKVNSPKTGIPEREMPDVNLGIEAYLEEEKRKNIEMPEENE